MNSSWDRVFLARHGQTEWNVAGRRQGRLDSPLTRRGVEQAHHAARVLRDHAVDAVFASPLGRAVATARIVAGTVGCELVVLDELAELDQGHFAGLTDGEIEDRHPGELGRRAEDKYRWRFPGGESYADVDRRAALALRAIAARPARRPLVVSHAMVGRMLLRHLLGLDPREALGREQPHGVVYEVDPVTAVITTHPAR